MEEVVLRCWICNGIALTTCNYCGKPVCKDTRSCYKLVEGLDPGWACTACYAIIVSRGLLERFIGIAPVPPPAGWEDRHD